MITSLKSLTEGISCYMSTKFNLRCFTLPVIPGDPKKYSCLIKHKMQNKRGIFKNICLHYQWANLDFDLLFSRAIFCESHPTCDSRVFRISSYFNQLKIKVILEHGRNFIFIKHFVEFLGSRETTLVFQEMQSVPTSYILKALSASWNYF